jgi:hypothetical protein
MILKLNGYAVALLGAACLSLVTTCAAWARRKQSPGGTHFALMMACIVLWGLMAGMEAAAATLPAKLLFSKLSYIGICGVVPLLLRFAVAYAGKETRRPWRFLVWAVPAATLLLVFTNERHHLVWTFLTPIHDRYILYSHGAWYWVWVAWCAAASIASLILVVHAALQCRKSYFRQTIILVAGMVLPWAGEALYLSPTSPFPGLDLPTIGFAVMGALVLLGMSRFSLFDIIPVARTTLFERMSDGVVALDAHQRLVDMNRAAEALLVEGQKGRGDLVSVLRPLLPAGALGPDPVQADIRLPGRPERWLDLVTTPLRNARGILTGHLIVLRDVTFRQMVEQEKEMLVAALQTALTDVKSLRGLIPMCSCCKKIRDDKGRWQSLELYVQQHSEARFSHGICDDCFEKLYPEIARK